MTHTRNRFKDWLLLGATIVLLVLCLPFLAALAFATRFVLVGVAAVAVAGGVVAYAVSPQFRDWLRGVTEEQLSYKGLLLATDVAVSPSHSWARIEPDGVQVGADDLAQAVLGPLDGVDLPAPGRRVRRGEAVARLRRGDRSVELRAPVSGTVTGCNGALRVRPQLVNDEPFARGWVARIRADDPRAERRRLLRGRDLRAWFRREVDRLISSVLAEEALAPSLPDGGPVVGELYRQIDDRAWRRVTATFFDAAPGAERETS